MSDVILLGLPPSSYVRTARMVCANKGVTHTLQPVDFRSPEYRAHHPFGRMPAMQHGEVTLYEALAIAIYVDETFDGPALQPSDPLGRAKMMQWISVVNDYIYETVVGCCVAERFVKPMRGMDPDEARIADALPLIMEQLDVIETALDDQPYLCGAAVTLADLFLAPVLHYLAATPEGQSLLPSRTNIGSWMDRMATTQDYNDINRLGP